MAKVKQLIKEFWGSDKKSNYLRISKRTIKRVAEMSLLIM